MARRPEPTAIEPCGYKQTFLPRSSPGAIVAVYPVTRHLYHLDGYGGKIFVFLLRCPVSFTPIRPYKRPRPTGPGDLSPGVYPGEGVSPPGPALLRRHACTLGRAPAIACCLLQVTKACSGQNCTFRSTCTVSAVVSWAMPARKLLGVFAAPP